jgi:hypothetical protein
VQDGAVAACDLGLVEGDVGGDQRFVVRLHARVKECATDADGRINPAGTDGVRLLADGLAEALGQVPDRDSVNDSAASKLRARRARPLATNQPKPAPGRARASF